MSLEIMVFDPTPDDTSQPFRLFPVKVMVDSLDQAMYIASAAKTLQNGVGGGIFIQDQSNPAYLIPDNRDPSRIGQRTADQLMDKRP